MAREDELSPVDAKLSIYPSMSVKAEKIKWETTEHIFSKLEQKDM